MNVVRGNVNQELFKDKSDGSRSRVVDFELCFRIWI